MARTAQHDQPEADPELSQELAAEDDPDTGSGADASVPAAGPSHEVTRAATTDPESDLTEVVPPHQDATGPDPAPTPPDSRIESGYVAPVYDESYEKAVR
jgi:hypothetical protein